MSDIDADGEQEDEEHPDGHNSSGSGQGSEKERTSDAKFDHWQGGPDWPHKDSRHAESTKHALRSRAINQLR